MNVVAVTARALNVLCGMKPPITHLQYTRNEHVVSSMGLCTTSVLIGQVRYSSCAAAMLQYCRVIGQGDVSRRARITRALKCSLSVVFPLTLLLPTHLATCTGP